MASSSSSSGVPPGFRFHPTDEELLLYYLKKKVSFEKFDLDVIKDVDLNKMEPWDLQERCRIGSTPQNEWYFFSHKDRKYPTGSRTNRATHAGFWKATGRDKCIRTTYKKIGMRKTLVFYKGRAPHGQKTDWIMHEYRLEDSDDPQGGGNEDGWVVCRVFKKKCFFKTGSEGSANQGGARHANTETGHDLRRPPSLVDSQYVQQNLHPHHNQASGLYNLHYPQLPAITYSQVQVQDLLPSNRPSSYDFPVLPSVDPSAVAKTYEAGLAVGACEPMQQVGGGRDQSANEWAVLDSMEARFANNPSGAVMPQMNQISGQRSGEMDLWGYGKRKLF